MNKFKVGDRVKIKDDSELHSSSLLKGKIYTINVVGEYGGLLIEEIYDYMFIDPNNFELVQKEDTMTFLNEEKIKFKNLKDDEKLLIINNMDKLEYYSTGKWGKLIGTGTFINIDGIYRIKPKQLNIPWEHIKPEFKYAAMNKNGRVFGYTDIPYIKCNDIAWSVNYGDYAPFNNILNIDTHGVEWQHSLVQRPE